MSASAVDTNPAQHHLSSLASQLMSVGFVCRWRERPHDLGSCICGWGDLDPASSQQVLEEGLGGLILTWRGRRAHGKGCTGNLRRSGSAAA